MMEGAAMVLKTISKGFGRKTQVGGSRRMGARARGGVVQELIPQGFGTTGKNSLCSSRATCDRRAQVEARLQQKRLLRARAPPTTRDGSGVGGPSSRLKHWCSCARGPRLKQPSTSPNTSPPTTIGSASSLRIRAFLSRPPRESARERASGSRKTQTGRTKEEIIARCRIRAASVFCGPRRAQE